MKAKLAQYLNEFVSLTILAAMVVALVAGQASANSRPAEDVVERLESQTDTLRLVIDTEIDNLAPVAGAILGESIALSGELTLEITPGKGDKGVR